MLTARTVRRGDAAVSEAPVADGSTCQRPMPASREAFSATPRYRRDRALLTRFARTRDAVLRERIVHAHEALVHHFANRYAKYGEMQEDLYRAGMIGLINAVDHFDPSRRLKFSTYAVPSIVGEIKRHLRDRSWSIKVSRELRERYLKAITVKSDLANKLGREPTLRDMTIAMGVGEDELRAALNLDLVRYTISFSRCVVPGIENGTQLSINQMLGAEDQQILDMPMHIDLTRAIERLEPRQRTIVVGIYYQDMSQSDLGQTLHLSQMQISRLHKKALETLREGMVDDLAA